MTGGEQAVKRYVVRLSGEERERLEDRNVCGRTKLNQHTACVQRQNNTKGETGRYDK